MSKRDVSNQPKPWKRRLWGVVFTGSDPRDPLTLIGTGWDLSNRPLPLQEPPRALLFRTREQARAWCRNKMDTWARGDDIVRRWRVRPVAVRETVELIEPSARATGAKGLSNA